MQSCSRGSRQHCTGKIPVRCCLNTFGTTSHRSKPSERLSGRLQITLHRKNLVRCCLNTPGTSCLKGSRKIAFEEICPPPPSPNSKASRKPNPDPDRGAIFRTPFERSSLGSTLLRCANVFNPTCFLDMTQEKLQIRWKVLLKCFYELHILSAQKCDKAMLEFKSFVCDTKSKCQVELQGFIPKVRLKKFYFEDICI